MENNSAFSSIDDKNDHSQKILRRMHKYMENQQLCDVVLISGVDDTRIPAHRLVLSAASDYFDAMFTGSMRETKEETVTLEEVHGDILQMLVNFCYTGNIVMCEENIEILLDTACLLQFDVVVTTCIEFIANKLDSTNCLEISLYAEQRSLQPLQEKAIDYACRHFEEVSRNPEYLELSADQIGELLAHDYLNVEREEDVLYCLMSWVEQNPSERCKHISKLLSSVRLSLLPQSVIDECLKPYFSLHSQLLVEVTSMNTKKYTNPRKSTLLLLAVGLNMDDFTIKMESYCPYRNKWTLLKKTLPGCRSFAVALIRDELYIIGGSDTSGALNTVQGLNLRTMTVTQYTPMNSSRWRHGVAVLEGHMYAVGGRDYSNFLNSVERWNPVANTWKYIAPMLNKRWDAGVAVLENRLFVIGGSCGSHYHSTVECYDQQTNNWTQITKMNMPRSSVGVTVVNNLLYAAGGYCSSGVRTNTVERYDIQIDKWTLICPLSSERIRIECASLGGYLIAVGGHDGQDELKTVEKYDSQANTWNELSAIQNKYYSLCLVTIPNIISPE